MLTRGECAEWLLPCKLKACKHHLNPPKHEPVIWHLGRSYTSAWRQAPGFRARLLRRAKGRMLRERRTVSVVSHDGEVLQVMAPSCALDFADLGGASLSEIGQVMGVTSMRIKQIEASALCAARPLFRKAGVAPESPVDESRPRTTIADLLIRDAQRGEINLSTFADRHGATYDAVAHVARALKNQGKLSASRGSDSRKAIVYRSAEAATAPDVRDLDKAIVGLLRESNATTRRVAAAIRVHYDYARRRMNALVREGTLEVVVEAKRGVGGSPAVYGLVKREEAA